MANNFTGYFFAAQSFIHHLIFVSIDSSSTCIHVLYIYVLIFNTGPAHALLNTPTRAADHTHRHRTPTPWDEVSIWTTKAWDEVSYNPPSHTLAKGYYPEFHALAISAAAARRPSRLGHAGY